MEKIMAKKSFYKIEMLFLKILEKEDCYGYQLTQSIQDITNGLFRQWKHTVNRLGRRTYDYFIPLSSRPKRI